MEQHNQKQAKVGKPKLVLMSKTEVCDLIGVTFPTLWQWMRDGRFPRARQLYGKTVWFEHEIDAFLAGLPPQKYIGDPGYTPDPKRQRSPGSPPGSRQSKYKETIEHAAARRRERA